MKIKRSLFTAGLRGMAIINLISCATIPKGAVAVKPFD